MEKFKIKGTIIEELPELEIEAENIDEAEEKYTAKYEKGEIESEGFIIDFENEDEDDFEEDDEELED
jgi:hypothetical protein